MKEKRNNSILYDCDICISAKCNVKEIVFGIWIIFFFMKSEIWNLLNYLFIDFFVNIVCESGEARQVEWSDDNGMHWIHNLFVRYVVKLLGKKEGECQIDDHNVLVVVFLVEMIYPFVCGAEWRFRICV